MFVFNFEDFVLLKEYLRYFLDCIFRNKRLLDDVLIILFGFMKGIVVDVLCEEFLIFIFFLKI